MKQKLYICAMQNDKIMDLEVRKYHLIQELFRVEEESVRVALWRVLKHDKKSQKEIFKAQKKRIRQPVEKL